MESGRGAKGLEEIRVEDRGQKGYKFKRTITFLDIYLTYSNPNEENWKAEFFFLLGHFTEREELILKHSIRNTAFCQGPNTDH